MRPPREGEVRRLLWSLHGALALGGLLLLAHALFVRRPARPNGGIALEPPGPRESLPTPLAPGVEKLAGTRLTHRLPKPKAAPLPGRPPLESMVKLTGIMDHGPEEPAVALLELAQTHETKGLKIGDPIGETTAIIRDIGNGVTIEYDHRAWRLTFRGAEVLPDFPPGDRPIPRPEERPPLEDSTGRKEP